MKAVYIILLFCFTLIVINAKPKQAAEIQRQSKGVFDCQFNTKSNFQFYVSNNGITFLNIPENKGGGFWPRGSLNEYLYGGGLWFGALKWMILDSGTVGNPMYYRKLSKFCELTFNPGSGSSWFVPGRIEDGEFVDETDFKKYRVHFSTDMNSDGEPINVEDGPNWPLWKTEASNQKFTGSYIYEIENRNENTYPLGPSFISDEDIFCTYKDTDLNYYEGGVDYRKNIGYPLGLQVEQTVYSWDDDEKQDMIIIYYKVKNLSMDTLYNCWLTPVLDPELATFPNIVYGAGNDFVRYYDEDESLNLGITWSRMNRGEFDIGYLGASMILTPAVYECHRDYDTLINEEYISYCAMCIERDTISIADNNNPGEFKDTVICLKELEFDKFLTNFPRNESAFFPKEQQLGLNTFRRWTIDNDFDIVDDESRYNYISAHAIELGEGEPGDYRMLFSTGPFNLLPGQSVSCAVQINFAMPSLGGDATGETDDLTDLIEKVKLGRIFFYNEIISKVEEQERKLSNSFIVYPNPASDKIFIKHNLTGESYLTIYDILGRNVSELVNSYEVILSSSDVILSSSKDILEINIGNLQSGNYVILLNDGNNVISENLCVIK